MLRLSALFLGFIIALCSQLTAVASIAEMDPFDEGVRHFNACRFTHAANSFEEALLRRPKDPYIHYYLANALVHMRNHDRAAKHFQHCYQLDPFGPVSGYCRQALKLYRKPIPADPDVFTNVPSKPPANVAPVAPSIGTLRMVEQQAQAEKLRHKDYAESMAMGIRGGAENKARQIREDGELAAKKILHEPVPIVGSGFHPIGFLEDRRERAEQVRKQAEENARRVREMAEDQVAEYKTWSEQKEKSLDEAAVSLQSQLKSSPVAGSVKLKPVGTSLFVRNYESSNPGKPAPDVRNSIVRIVPSGSAQEQTDAPAPPGPEKSVSGSILK